MSQQLPVSPSFGDAQAAAAASLNHDPHLSAGGEDAALAAQKAAIAAGVTSTFERPQVFGGGRQGAKPYQEDSFFSWCSPTNRVIVGGVFDGHGGYNGLLASQTARDASLAYLQTNAHGQQGTRSAGGHRQNSARRRTEAIGRSRTRLPPCRPIL